jgi:uncharacterized protein with HEPN domain
MSVKDVRVYISDIINSVCLIKEFTVSLNFDDFQKDIKTQYAVIRCFEVIGEAAKRVPEDFKKQCPAVPWKIMAGMRDRLIHGYDVVDASILWRTVKNDIPELEKNLNNIDFLNNPPEK